MQEKGKRLDKVQQISSLQNIIDIPIQINQNINNTASQSQTILQSTKIDGQIMDQQQKTVYGWFDPSTNTFYTCQNQIQFEYLMNMFNLNITDNQDIYQTPFPTYFDNSENQSIQQHQNKSNNL